MIKVSNLTKVYNDKHKNSCIAINSISFDLPDTGLIFIIGKSGSGKSTLLNMLGGLDSPTLGDINCSGNLISKLNKKELTSYRQSYVSFIFQDYHIMDDLTVFDNIKLTLDLQGKHDDALIKRIIHRVDLDGLEARYPKELSGGQKQRIAVARALVKEDAKVILCDEPTGNLDKETTRDVLNTLKKISLEKLVVVVSHNTIDAEKYADRIIKLFDGKIIDDHQRSKHLVNDFEIKKNTCYLPHYDDLTKEQVELVNQKIKKEGLSFKQIGNDFVKTKALDNEMDNASILDIKAPKKTINSLFKVFFKKIKKSIFVSAFLTALIFTCFAMLQSFIHFDSASEAARVLINNGQNNLNLTKGYRSIKGYIEEPYVIEYFFDEDIDKVKATGYQGNIFKRYPINFSLYYSGGGINLGTKNPSNNLSEFYLKYSYGTVVCNEEYCDKVIGKGSNITYLNKASIIEPYGVYITDYLADCILYRFSNKYNNYDDILGVFNPKKATQGYINGIIKTDYSTKYQAIKNKFDEVLHSDNYNLNELKEVIESDEFIRFIEDVQNYLGIAYSFNDNFYDDFKEFASEYVTTGYISYFNYKSTDGSINRKLQKAITVVPDFKSILKDDEIILNYGVYKELFGFIPEDGIAKAPYDKVTFSFYKNRDKQKDLIYEKTFKIKLCDQSDVYVSKKTYKELFDVSYAPCGLMLDNINDASKIIKLADEADYLIYNAQSSTISVVDNVIATFKNFFIFAMVIFLILTIAYIIWYTTKIIRQSRYEIGILKALGTSNKDILKIFGREILIYISLSFVLINVGIFLGSFVANLICCNSFETILKINLYGLTLVKYYPMLGLIDSFSLVILAVLSSLLALVKLLKVNPIDIIRSKE